MKQNFYGTDFNPAHAAHANQLAEQSHVEHFFYDDSFLELLNRQRFTDVRLDQLTWYLELD